MIQSKILRSFYLIVILSIFLLSLIHVAEAAVCCIVTHPDGTITNVAPNANNKCSQGTEYEMLQRHDCISNDPNSNTALFVPGMCVVNDECVATQGIYFNTENPSKSIGTCSGKIERYDATRCKNVVSQNNNGNLNNQNEQGSSGNVNINPGYNNVNIKQELVSKAENAKCYESGYPYGLFYDAKYCNMKNFCFYDPNKLGKLGLDSLVVSNNDLKAYNNTIDPYEKISDLYSCKSVTSITSCFDFKTKKGCLKDSKKVANYLKSIHNVMYKELSNCVWIPNKEYVSGFLLGSSGICISNYTKDSKFYNLRYYHAYGNLIKNPSFEFGKEGWNFTGGAHIINYTYSFNGNHSLFLGRDGSAKQNISYVMGDKTYLFSFYILGNKNFKSTDKLDVIFYLFNDSGSTLKEYKIPLSNYNKTGIFQLVETPNNYPFSLVISPDVNYIIMKVTADSSQDVIVDAFSLIKSDQHLVNKKIPPFSVDFEKLPQASNCEKCFTRTSFNDCTAKKSQFLGDCYYTIPSLDKYYGEGATNTLAMKFHNFPYFNSSVVNKYNVKTDLRWYAQSLPNSLMFCELYLNKKDCLNPNNFVNKYYKILNPLSGGTLCKWSDTIGCYKDSNNDNIPDELYNYTYLTGDQVIPNNANDWKSKITEQEFDRSCDMTPPFVYIYFSAENVTSDGNLTEVYFSHLNDSKNYYGDIKIHIFYYDKNNTQCNAIHDYCKLLNLPNCPNIDFTKIAYFTASSNGKKYLSDIKDNKKSGAFFFVKTFDLKKFLDSMDRVDTTKKSLVHLNITKDAKNGVNIINLSIADQSFNFLKPLHLVFKLDDSPPVITLKKDNKVVKDNGNIDIFAKNIILSVNAKDQTAIKYCHYYVKAPQFSQYINDSVFNVTIDGKKTSLDFKINVSALVFNSSPSGMWVDLYVNCSDYFNHVGVNHYNLFVDLTTDFKLLKPTPFDKPEVDSGFLNDNAVTFLANSSDDTLKTCNLEAAKGSLGGTLEELKDSEGNSVGYNITFVMNNPKDYLNLGNNTINFVCEDSYGVSKTFPYTFYFDDVAPIIKNYSIQADDVYFDGKKYYTLDNNFIVKMLLDGTHSWIKNKINLSLIGSKSNNLQYNGLVLKIDDNVSKQNFTAHLSFSPLFNNQNINYFTKEISDNFYLRNISVTVFDMANNSKNIIIPVYYDKTTPKIIVRGDAATYQDKLFVKNNNPNLNLSFGTPSYDLWNCTYHLYPKVNPSGLWDSGHYLGKKSDFIFKVNNINDNVKIKFVCNDVYHRSLSSVFTIKKHSSGPGLSIIITPSNFYIYKEKEFTQRGLNSTINLDVIDELPTTCDYNIINYPKFGNYLSCSKSNKVLITSSQIGPLKWLYYSPGSDNLCHRTSTDVPSGTTINVGINVSCKDLLGYENYTIKNVSFTYSNSILKNISFNYSKGEITSYLETYSNNINYVYYLSNLSFVGKNTPVNDIMKNILVKYSNFASERGILFKGSGTFSTENMNEGIYHSFGVVLFNDSGELSYVDSIEGNFIVDKTPPQINLKVLNKNVIDGFTYGDKARVSLSVKDLGNPAHGLKNISVYLNGNLVFTSDNISDIYNDFNVTFDSKFDSDLSDNSFGGIFVINNLEYNHNYVLRIDAEDLSGNIASENTTLKMKKGIYFDLVNSRNLVVNNVEVGLTRVDAPVVNISVFGNVSSCVIRPYYYVSENLIPNGKSYNTPFNMVKEGLHNYIYDLSKTAFNLSRFENTSQYINILCKDTKNKPYVSFFLIRKILTMPDYIMKPLSANVILQNGTLSSQPGNDLSNYLDFFKKVELINKRDYPINCSYWVNPNNKHSIYVVHDKDFTLDLSDYSEEKNITVSYICRDTFNVEGPLKKLTFYNKVVSNVSIIDPHAVDLTDGTIFYPDSKGNLYVRNDSFNFIFYVNKKASCTYRIGNSAINDLLAFFMQLGYYIVPNADNKWYEFNIKNINDVDNGETLSIICNDYDYGGDSEVRKDYIIYKVGPNDLKVNIIKKEVSS